MTQTPQTSSTWEYAAVEITPSRRGRRPGSPDDVIARLTTSGWCPMTTITRPARYHGGTWTYFKRQARDCRS